MPSPVMPCPWDAAAQRLFAALGADKLRAVGGCVRDALLGLPMKDLDLATVIPPEEVMATLTALGMTVKPTGLAHGTVTAVLDGRGYEITTLRRDVETDGRRAVIAYTTDWAEDAQRRDFTVNALYADAQGAIHDGTGQGLIDLEARRLRFIGDADLRIREDFLRILRLFRFVAQLPGFVADEAGLAACARQKDGLARLSSERVTDEWLKLLRGRNAAPGLILLNEAGIGPLYNESERAPARLARAHELNVALSDALLLTLTFEAVPPVFRLPGRVEKAVALLVSLKDSDIGFEEAAYRHGQAAALDLALWRVIAGEACFDGDHYARWLAYAPPQSPVKSADFIEKGLSGPALGQALKDAEEAWIATAFSKSG